MSACWASKRAISTGHSRRGETEDLANYAIMSRDEAEVCVIMDEGGPAWTRSGTGYLYLTVPGVEAVYASVKSQGIMIIRDLRREN